MSPPLRLKPLPNFRLPDYPNNPLYLDGQPLAVIDTSSSTSQSSSPSSDAPKNDLDNDPLTPALGIATILYNYHPAALAAFLDLDAWISLTWTFSYSTTTTTTTGTAAAASKKKQTIEIGRIRNQITFGILEGDGEKWGAVFCFDIAEPPSSTLAHEGTGEVVEGGTWRPNPRESMVGAKPLPSASAVHTLALAFVRDLLRKRRWEAGTAKGSVHKLFVEYAPMMDDDVDEGEEGKGEKDDVEGWGGDGILMNPHWLYEGLDLGVCCACAAYNDTSSSSSESIFWAPRQTDTDTLTQTDAEKDKEKKDVKEKGEGVKLNRCGRCGTAAYCSPACQRRDWAVHKAVCGLPLLERGKMLKIVEKGGLVKWDVGRVYAPLGGGV
jgi:hypothetical protein